MATTHTLFREYILLRLRAVIYATVILTLLLAGVLIFLASSSVSNVNRAGLILQFLAGLAILPELISIGKSQHNNEDPEPSPQTGSELNNPTPRTVPDGVLLEQQQYFDLYLAHNRPFLAGNLVVSLWMIGFLVTLAFDPQPDMNMATRLLWTLLSLVGFAWVNLLMLNFIYRLAYDLIPSAVQRTFFVVDFLVTIPGLFFAAAFYLISNWAWAGLRFVYQDSPMGPRRVLLMVSLPFFLIGTLLIFIATFG